MPKRKVIPPELARELRYEYEETNTPIDDLAARADMSRKTFYNWVREQKWTMRCPGRGGAGHSTPLSLFEGKREAAAKTRPRKPAAAKGLCAPPDGTASGADSPAAGSPLDRQQLAARIQRSVERELDAIERVLDLLQPQNGNEAERAARTLAALARTLREVATLDTDPAAEPDHDDDAGPRDMEEFRRELTRRIEAIIAEPDEPASPQPQF